MTSPNELLFLLARSFFLHTDEPISEAQREKVLIAVYSMSDNRGGKRRGGKKFQPMWNNKEAGENFSFPVSDW